MFDSATEGVLNAMDTSGGAQHHPTVSCNGKHTGTYSMYTQLVTWLVQATMLMMKAHSCYINKYATLMFHAANYSYGGHSGNMDAHVKYFTPLLTKLVNEVYEHFLSLMKLHGCLMARKST